AHGTADMLTDTDEINLEVFNYDGFLEFIEWTVRNTNKRPGTISGYRSALRHYYKQHRVPVPLEFDDDIKEIFQ
ncbi:unnamed protein product, partial [Aphanomyces euteiches]